MTDTQERFLRTILGLVPLESVVELHLFPAIRRGTLETGVAVIAASLPAAPLAVVDEAGDLAAPADATGRTAVVDAADVPAEDVAHEGEAAFETEPTDDSPYADGPAARRDDDDSAGFSDEASDTGVESAARAAAPRLRILTANYRHTIKGVERGKWSVDVQDEAVAPLDAVEAVLRGVRHRSTEPADPELIPHDALAALMTPVSVAPAA